MMEKEAEENGGKYGIKQIKKRQPVTLCSINGG